MSITDRYVVGVDFGTLSGRAVVVRTHDGAELGSAVTTYPHAVMDHHLAASTGRTLPPDWVLQVPGDYVSVLKDAVPAGVGTDFTACTMVPTLADGTPLSEVEGFRDRPHAYVKLWKHHAAQPHADRINALAHERGRSGSLGMAV